MKRLTSSLLVLLLSVCLLSGSAQAIHLGMISPATSVSISGSSWQAWDEVAEAGWGDSGTNTCILDGAVDDDSLGVATGADLIYTQSAGVAAAVLSGGYYSRAFDGIDDYISITPTLAGIISGKSTWSIIIKFKDFEWAVSDRVMDFYHANNRIRVINDDGIGHLGVLVTANTTTTLNASFTDVVPRNTDFYLWIGGDGTNTYAGWSLTRPTSHTAVPVGQRVQAAAFAQFSEFTSPRFMAAYDGSAPQEGTVYYFIISQSAIVTY